MALALGPRASSPALAAFDRGAVVSGDEPKAWHSRGYVPHWEAGEVPQSITFRMADSLPKAVLDQWRLELNQLPDGAREQERRKRIEAALDSGHGSGALAKPPIGVLVENALLHFDAQRYRLHAWAIMPNHVHVLATPLSETLSDIVQTWKSFTARKANSLLGGRGSFWAPEYYDRAIRDDVHYANAVDYIAMNPVRARCAGGLRIGSFLVVGVGALDAWVRAGEDARGPRASAFPIRMRLSIRPFVRSCLWTFRRYPQAAIRRRIFMR
jgi:hypothetical protein